MAILPIFNTDLKPLSLLQTAWATLINPILRNPRSSAIILDSVPLVIGANSIDHLLGRKLVGWSIVRQRALASIYDTQDSNPRPALTLTLVSSAAVTVDIEVF